MSPAYDFHQHLWPEAFISALSRRKTPPLMRGRTLELTIEPPYTVDLDAHRLETRLALLDRHGIDVAVISLQPTVEVELLPPEEAEPLVEAYHDGILELAEASDGRIRPLAAGVWREGFAGACVSGAALVHEPERLEPLLAELERHGGFLFVHPGPPPPAPPGTPGWWPAIVDYTAEMQAAYAAWLARGAAAHPDLQVVFAILAGGAPIQLERLVSRGVEARSALHANVYFETASYGRRALELSLSTYGVTQLVFGSDAPVIDPEPTLRALEEFGEAVTDLVLRENPSKLLS